MTVTIPQRLCVSLWAIFAMLMAAPVSAQQPAPQAPGIDALVLVGTRNTILESTCSSGGGQSMVGGSVSYHGQGRGAVGGEVTYIHPCASQTFTYYHPRLNLMIQGRVDLNRGSGATVYLVGGVGATRHVSQFAPTSVAPACASVRAVW